jgi:hypothetical protein
MADIVVHIFVVIVCLTMLIIMSQMHLDRI